MIQMLKLAVKDIKRIISYMPKELEKKKPNGQKDWRNSTEKCTI